MRIKEFIRKLEEDNEFAARYQMFNSIDEILTQAGTDGYLITEEELVDVLKQLNDDELSDELSDEALESVCGGVIPVFYKKPPTEV